MSRDDLFWKQPRTKQVGTSIFSFCCWCLFCYQVVVRQWNSATEKTSPRRCSGTALNVGCLPSFPKLTLSSTTQINLVWHLLKNDGVFQAKKNGMSIVFHTLTSPSCPGSSFFLFLAVGHEFGSTPLPSNSGKGRLENAISSWWRACILGLKGVDHGRSKSYSTFSHQNNYPLGNGYISHLGKRKIIDSKCHFGGIC